MEGRVALVVLDQALSGKLLHELVDHEVVGLADGDVQKCIAFKAVLVEHVLLLLDGNEGHGNVSQPLLNSHHEGSLAFPIADEVLFLVGVEVVQGTSLILFYDSLV